jgi:putative transposase
LVELCPDLSLRRQCELVGISRSGFYYEPIPESEENLALMRRLDELNLEHPFYGSRRLTALLQREGQPVNRKRVARLLELMGVEVVYPKRNLSQPGEGHRIYPYLLEGLEITGPDQVWCSDITYVPMAEGFMYLVAVMDWWSRYVLAWELSNSLDSEFCIRAWTAALAGGRQPLIHNTDQGSQFTSEAYLDAVESVGVDVSMDGRGRWIDNRFIERLWRLCRHRHKRHNAGSRLMPGASNFFGRSLRICRFSRYRCRHYQRLLRKSKSCPEGLKRPCRPVNRSVFASACSLSSRLAWR